MITIFFGTGLEGPEVARRQLPGLPFLHVDHHELNPKNGQGNGVYFFCPSGLIVCRKPLLPDGRGQKCGAADTGENMDEGLHAVVAEKPTGGQCYPVQ